MCACVVPDICRQVLSKKGKTKFGHRASRKNPRCGTKTTKCVSDGLSNACLVTCIVFPLTSTFFTSCLNLRFPCPCFLVLFSLCSSFFACSHSLCSSSLHHFHVLAYPCLPSTRRPRCTRYRTNTLFFHCRRARHVDHIHVQQVCKALRTIMQLWSINCNRVWKYLLFWPWHGPCSGTL